jgi:hypothetical protein
VNLPEQGQLSPQRCGLAIRKRVVSFGSGRWRSLGCRARNTLSEFQVLARVELEIWAIED